MRYSILQSRYFDFHQNEISKILSFHTRQPNGPSLLSTVGRALGKRETIYGVDTPRRSKRVHADSAEEEESESGIGGSGACFSQAKGP